MKRVAQRLVAIGEEYPELLMAAASAPFPDSDPSRRAVSTAVISLAMARQLSTDRLTLTSLALAALLCQVGESRLGSAEEPERLGPSMLVALTIVGRLPPNALRRNVVGYEALRMPSPTSSPHGQDTAPALLSSVLFVARRFNDLRTPDGSNRPPNVGQVLEQLEGEADDEARQALYQLLVSGLGFLPCGTFVELDTGEVAQITGTPALALDFARPQVRILTDGKHKILAAPLDVDLARPTLGEPPRVVCRALPLGGALRFS